MNTTTVTFRNPTLPVIKLNVNGLNIPIKRQNFPEPSTRLRGTIPQQYKRII